MSTPGASHDAQTSLATSQAQPSAAHTPGPWAAFTDDSGSSPHTNIVSYAPRTDCVFSLPGHDKHEPNVRLIAAAPDLLEALKFYADPANWQDFIARPPGRDSHYHSAHADLDKGQRARAAIAKAEGRSQAGTTARLDPLREEPNAFTTEHSNPLREGE